MEIMIAESFHSGLNRKIANDVDECAIGLMNVLVHRRLFFPSS